jgi:hypothetical protein
MRRTHVFLFALVGVISCTKLRKSLKNDRKISKNFKFQKVQPEGSEMEGLREGSHRRRTTPTDQVFRRSEFTKFRTAVDSASDHSWGRQRGGDSELQEL